MNSKKRYKMNIERVMNAMYESLEGKRNGFELYKLYKKTNGVLPSEDMIDRASNILLSRGEDAASIWLIVNSYERVIEKVKEEEEEEAKRMEENRDGYKRV